MRETGERREPHDGLAEIRTIFKVPFDLALAFEDIEHRLHRGLGEIADSFRERPAERGGRFGLPWLLSLCSPERARVAGRVIPFRCRPRSGAAPRFH